MDMKSSAYPAAMASTAHTVAHTAARLVGSDSCAPQSCRS